MRTDRSRHEIANARSSARLPARNSLMVSMCASPWCGHIGIALHTAHTTPHPITVVNPCQPTVNPLSTSCQPPTEVCIRTTRRQVTVGGTDKPAMAHYSRLPRCTATRLSPSQGLCGRRPRAAWPVRLRGRLHWRDPARPPGPSVRRGQRRSPAPNGRWSGGQLGGRVGVQHLHSSSKDMEAAPRRRCPKQADKGAQHGAGRGKLRSGARFQPSASDTCLVV